MMRELKTIAGKEIVRFSYTIMCDEREDADIVWRHLANASELYMSESVDLPFINMSRRLNDVSVHCSEFGTLQELLTMIGII